MRRRRLPIWRIYGVLVLLSTAGATTAVTAQGSPTDAASTIRLAIGFGVDTAPSSAREIVALWRGYLQDHPERALANPRWSRAEQSTHADADLLRTFVYQGFTHFTLVHLGPSPGELGAYELRTLVGRAEPATLDVYPLALYRAYAIREGGRWVLSNALLHRTRTWHRRTVGRLQYIAASPALVDPRRATRTARFVDSLGAAFGVAVPDISYYVAEDLSAMYTALGLDFFPLATDTAGGRALVPHRIVFVGGSSEPESNRHELAHVVLGSLARPQTHRLLTEGVATWVGGSAGLTYADLLPGLATWLNTSPHATLLDILSNPPRRSGTLDVGYNVLAVICALAHERGGVSAVRQLMDAGPTPADAVQTIGRVLGLSAAEVDNAWRRRVRETRSAR